MDPFFARNRLSAYIDGLLPPEEAARVEESLAADPALREEYEAMRASIAFLRRHGPTPAPPGFHARVMASLPAEETGGVVVALRRFFRQVPVEALALAAAAALVVVVISRPGQDGEADPSPAAQGEAPADVPPLELKSGSASPAPLQPAPDLSLPPPETAAAQETAKKERSPAAAGGGGALKKQDGAATEPFYAPWEQEGSAIEGPEDDLGATPAELSEGVRPGSLIAHQYRLRIQDAEVLFTLQNIAQRVGGRLQDTKGLAFAPRTLTGEENYARVQLIVPASQVGTVDDYLLGLGATAAGTESDGPLSGAESVIFLIEVTYLP